MATTLKIYILESFFRNLKRDVCIERHSVTKWFNVSLDGYICDAQVTRINLLYTFLATCIIKKGKFLDFF